MTTGRTMGPMDAPMDTPVGTRKRYDAVNAAALGWMLDRPSLHGGFLNTKLNAMTLQDYRAKDGLRGPEFLYGWIQGRGLEALVTHAAHFKADNPDLSARLAAAARALYTRLADLVRGDGHLYFLYDADLRPVYEDHNGVLRRQAPSGAIYTYSDAFAAKGLIAAAAFFELPEQKDHLDYFHRIIDAIEHDRFQMTERAQIGPDAISRQGDDFGPRMIALGAAGLLARLGHSNHTGFADRFIKHILSRHFDRQSHLLSNQPGGDACNVGHGIEFCGLVLDHLGKDADPGLVSDILCILMASYRKGRAGPGLVLNVSRATSAPLSHFCPWWSLPEAIRAAALAYSRSGDARFSDIWRDADDAFFRSFWRSSPPVAYQCMTSNGPVDHVPATPDLDPGYHTGLCLLAAAMLECSPDTR